jgi:hypothetical protein
MKEEVISAFHYISQNHTKMATYSVFTAEKVVFSCFDKSDSHPAAVWKIDETESLTFLYIAKARSHWHGLMNSGYRSITADEFLDRYIGATDTLAI